jgi:predicted ribosomally synthesized peptide with SipW-like signal peptide
VESIPPSSNSNSGETNKVEEMMNKRNVLLSLLVIAAIASTMVGGTLAGFSDTEQSSDNFFKVGDLDIKVAKVGSDWTGSDFRDDEPWGTGLQPLFAIDCASIGGCYSARRLISNYGRIDGNVSLHIRLAEDSEYIAPTTEVTIWYDDDGDISIEPAEIIESTLGELDCHPIVLGLLPGCTVRRFMLSIQPDASSAFSIKSDYEESCVPPRRWFRLEFSTEFQLVETTCPGFSDTEITTNYLESCGEGCSRGYWKACQHFDSWVPTGYATTDKLKNVFTAVTTYFPDLKNNTLLQALEYGGGDDLIGGARILLREAVGAVLNASHPDIEYPRIASDVISSVNAALASGNRNTMINLAGQLEDDNNLGCPLN